VAKGIDSSFKAYLRQFHLSMPGGLDHDPTDEVVGGQKNLGESTSESASRADQNPKVLEENQQLVNAKLAELHQSKVESGSKYRVRLSGIVLLNAVENRGAVDNLDFPSLAIPAGSGSPKGSFGATLQQSLLGLEVFGPEIHGARISGDVQFDFAGSSYNLSDGTTFGFARLRTGVVRLEWPNTSLIAGQDAQAAGVDGKRLVQTELRRKIGPTRAGSGDVSQICAFSLYCELRGDYLLFKLLCHR